MQDGLVPPLHPEEAAGIITGSEQILKEYAKKASLTAKDIIGLIEDAGCRQTRPRKAGY